MNEAATDLTVIIPAYNEAERIPSTLLDNLRFLKEQYPQFEIIVVDDGSTDETAKVVEQLAENEPRLRLLKLEQNQGKGGAVKAGMLEAKGKYALFNDADGSTPISEVKRLLESLEEEGKEVAIGSRAVASDETKVKTRLGRKIVGRIFNFAINTLVLPGIKDTQCGFKLFTRKAYCSVFPHQQIKGFSFDIEVLHLANKAGFGITEIPVNWQHVRGSKVSVIKDGIKMLLSALTIRGLHARTKLDIVENFQ